MRIDYKGLVVTAGDGEGFISIFKDGRRVESCPCCTEITEEDLKKVANLYLDIQRRDPNGFAPDKLPVKGTAVPKPYFYVNTPIGRIRVGAKNPNVAQDYPGVYVDYVKESGELQPLACTEYDPSEETLCTEVFPTQGACTRFAHDDICENKKQNLSWDEAKGLHETQKAVLSNLELEIAKTLIQMFSLREYHEWADLSRLECIPLAYTNTEDERIDIHVTADLKNLRIYTELSAAGDKTHRVQVSNERYENLRSMISDLETMCFESLVCVRKEEWAKFSSSHYGRKWLEQTFPVGSRLRLIYMDDIQAPPEGTCCTVRFIDDAGQILVRWDTGSSLALAYGEDEFEIINE